MPRFHANVKETLAARPPEVHEVTVQPTERMHTIKMSLKALQVSTLAQLHKARPELHLDEGGRAGDATSALLFRDHETQLRRQLDPIWHTLGPTVRQHVFDLRTLRVLSEYLDQYDAVSFLQYLELLQLSSRAFNAHSHWLFLPETDTLLLQARLRVFRAMEPPPDAPLAAAAASVTRVSATPALEESPKWAALGEALAALQRDPAGRGARTLVVCHDPRVCRQLELVVRCGGRAAMRDQFARFTKWRATAKPTAAGSAAAGGEAGEAACGCVWGICTSFLLLSYRASPVSARPDMRTGRPKPLGNRERVLAQMQMEATLAAERARATPDATHDAEAMADNLDFGDDGDDEVVPDVPEDFVPGVLERKFGFADCFVWSLNLQAQPTRLRGKCCSMRWLAGAMAARVCKHCI